MGDDGAFAIGIFTPCHYFAKVQNLHQIFHIGRVAANGLGAVLEGRVKTGQTELAFRRIVGQGGNDVLYGGAQNDLLFGDDLGALLDRGDDSLFGGDGQDEYDGPQGPFEGAGRA